MEALDRRSGNLLYGKNLDGLLDEYYYSYKTPQTRGVLVNFDQEILLFEEILENLTNQKSNYNTYSLLLTIQLFTPEKVKERILEMVFEYFDFGSFLPINPQVTKLIILFLSLLKEAIKEVCNSKGISDKFLLIVESSHSATYLVPIFDSEIMNFACKRIDVGGRILSSYLKDLISFKMVSLKNEVQLVNQIKEEMCFVSNNYKYDMKLKFKIINFISFNY